MSPPQPRPEVMAINAYVAGESKVGGVNRIIKLSSNEGAFGPPPGAQEAYRKVAAEIYRYPDGASTALRRSARGAVLAGSRAASYAAPARTS